MIFIYNCYGGTHSSTIAAAVHLNKLPADRLPTGKEILATDYFNKLTYKDMGRIIFRGADSEGNKVFTIGRGTSKVLIPCLENFINLIHKECGFNDKIVLSNMSPAVTPLMTLGGFFSRGLGIDFIGVPFLAKGSVQAFGKIVRLVGNTKERAKNMPGNVLVLKNE